MDKTPTRMSKLSLLHRAPHGPHDPTRIYPSERVPKYAVQTRRDYPTGLHPIPSRTVYPFVSHEIILKEKVGLQAKENRRRRKLPYRRGFKAGLWFSLLSFLVRAVLYFTRSPQSEYLLYCGEGKTLQGNMVVHSLVGN